MNNKLLVMATSSDVAFEMPSSKICETSFAKTFSLLTVNRLAASLDVLFKISERVSGLEQVQGLTTISQ